MRETHDSAKVDPSQATDSTLRKQGRECWPALILIAGLLMVIESLLAGRVSGRLAADPVTREARIE